MITMVIGNRLPIRKSAFVCLSTTKFLYYSINVMKPSNNNNTVSSFICRNQDVLPMEFLDTCVPCFKCRKENLGLAKPVSILVDLKQNDGLNLKSFKRLIHKYCMIFFFFFALAVGARRMLRSLTV